MSIEFLDQSLNRFTGTVDYRIRTWIMNFHTAPPVLFDDLVKMCLASELKSSVDKLVAIKMARSESAEIEPVSDIQAYLEKSIQEIEIYLEEQTPPHKVDWQLINQFFWSELGVTDNGNVE